MDIQSLYTNLGGDALKRCCPILSFSKISLGKVFPSPKGAFWLEELEFGVKLTFLIRIISVAQK
jgi:hypothetical protein